MFILRLSYSLISQLCFFKIMSQIKFFTFYNKLLVATLSGFILLAFTVIHYLWVTRISYIANIFPYTSLIFHMKRDA